MGTTKTKSKGKSIVKRLACSVLVIPTLAVACLTGIVAAKLYKSGDDIKESVFESASIVLNSLFPNRGGRDNPDTRESKEKEYNEMITAKVKEDIANQVVIEPETITESTPEAVEAKEYFESIKDLDDAFNNSAMAEYERAGEGIVYTITNDVLNYRALFMQDGSLYADLDMATSEDGVYKTISGIYRIRIVVDKKYYTINTYEDFLYAVKSAEGINVQPQFWYKDKHAESYSDLAENFFNKVIKNSEEKMIQLQNEGYDLSFDDGRMRTYGQNTLFYGFDVRIKAKNNTTGEEKYLYYGCDFDEMDEASFKQQLNDESFNNESLIFGCYYQTDEFYSDFAKAQQAGEDYINKADLNVNLAKTSKPSKKFYLDSDLNITEITMQ